MDPSNAESTSTHHNNNDKSEIEQLAPPPPPPQQRSIRKHVVKRFIRVPLCRQSRGYTCGVAALQSILQYYGDEYNESTLEEEVGCMPEYGTPYQNMIQFAESLGYEAAVHKEMTLHQLLSEVDAGRPVFVCLQAWADLDDGVPWSERWEDGHWTLVIGYDEGVDKIRKSNGDEDGNSKETVPSLQQIVSVLQSTTSSSLPPPSPSQHDDDGPSSPNNDTRDDINDSNIYFMDPSSTGTYTFIPVGEFLSRWHDYERDGNRLVHFGFTLTKDKVTYDKDIITPMN
eukprot:TRINITY_DN4406_c0_g2_i1.p1 TRINITY_DN4406_c0_g2~~TRINITY_DN4406_c0_g2_i1.p1  ORF type:complete len:285 (-),score=61.06 TRINITY_DN4406_c0_g2_i1:63-917(-)